ncbi:MAG: flippase [Patescibacteria group bacterium]
MSLTRKIAHNTAIQAIGKIFGLALSLITAGLVLRYLGQAGYGQYSTVTAFVMIFGIIIDFGLYIILLKKISTINQDTEKLVNNIFTLRVISGVIFLGLAPIIGFFMPYPGIVKIGILITCGFYLFISLNQLLSAIFQKFMTTYWIALGEFLGKTVLLASTLIFIYLKLDLKFILLSLVLGSFINFLINFFGSRKYFKIKFSYDKKIWLEILKESWPIALSIFFTLIYFKADTIILSLFQPESEVGIYGAPYKIVEVLIYFPTMFIGLALPILTKHWQEKNLEKFKQVLQKAFDFLVISAVPMIGGTIVLAEPIMRLLGGEEFIASAPILRILIIATATIFLGTLFTYLVVALNQQKKMLIGYSFVGVSALILYLIFIPKYSYWAAASITVYSEFMILIIAYFICYKVSKCALNFQNLLKVIFATLVMMLSLYMVPNYNIIFSILVGIVIYLAFLYLIKGISKEQILEIVSLKRNEDSN